MGKSINYEFYGIVKNATKTFYSNMNIDFVRIDFLFNAVGK